jgi:hypothetical protein
MGLCAAGLTFSLLTPLRSRLTGIWPARRRGRFDDELPERRFDNFQFVEHNRLRADVGDLERRFAEPFGAAQADAYFAMQMLMEVPDQFLAIRRLKLLE